MSRDQWRRRFCGGAPERGLRDWLTEPGSLTTRCRRSCRHFAVRVLRQGKGVALIDEESPRQLVDIREVVLECDGMPVIFAHSTLSTAAHGRLGRWFAGLGCASLGALLFIRPGFRREPIEFRRLDARHPLYRRAALLCDPGATLWARRSRHRFGTQDVLVTEVFLPAINALVRPPVRQI